MSRQHFGVLFISSALILTVGCATTPRPPVEESNVVVEKPEPTTVVLQSATELVSEEQVNIPPLESVTVHFDYDSAEVNASETGLIDSHVTYLKENAGQRLVLEGHTDERGSNEYNQALGQQRANAIFDALLAKGISSQQIRVVSFGETRPYMLGRDEETWRSNRRVEFIYELSEEQQAAFDFSAPQTLVSRE